MAARRGRKTKRHRRKTMPNVALRDESHSAYCCAVCKSRRAHPRFGCCSYCTFGSPVHEELPEHKANPERDGELDPDAHDVVVVFVNGAHLNGAAGLGGVDEHPATEVDAAVPWQDDNVTGQGRLA